MERIARVLAILTAFAFGTPASAAISYDIATDWSTITNPNGPWSLDQGGVPLSTHFISAFGIVGLDGWANPGLGGGNTAPTWLRVTGAGTTLSADIGDIVVHSAPDGAPLAQLSWTSPSAGTIDIVGQAWDAGHAPGRDDEWSLRLNGAELASNPSIVGTAKNSAAALFSNNLSPGQSLTGLAIAPGDVLVFEVNETAGIFGHFVGVELAVALTPVPLPASVLLLLPALAGVHRVLRRKALG